MARLASSSAATSAPPMRWTRGRPPAAARARAATPARRRARRCRPRAARARALLAEADGQPLVVDALVVHPGEHLDALRLERGAVDPAGGLAQAGAGLASPCAAAGAPARGAATARLRRRQPAARRAPGRPRPTPPPGRRGRATANAPSCDEELGDVEADAAGADDRDALAHRPASREHVDVGEHRRSRPAPGMRGSRGATPVASTTSS